MVILNYTGSPGEKIPQKVLGGGATFFDSHCRITSCFVLEAPGYIGLLLLFFVCFYFYFIYLFILLLLLLLLLLFGHFDSAKIARCSKCASSERRVGT